MKKVVLSMLLVFVLSFSFAVSTDVMTGASGQSYYASSSYTKEDLPELFGSYPYPFSITISSLNEDGSPNLAVAVPGLSKDGNYLTFGLAPNRTRENFLEREVAIVALYEYNPTAEEKNDRNKGCRIVVKYVGDEENKKLNGDAERPSIYMEIIEVLPIG